MNDEVPRCVCGATEEEEGPWWCGICESCIDHCEGMDEACYNYEDVDYEPDEYEQRAVELAADRAWSAKVDYAYDPYNPAGRQR